MNLKRKFTKIKFKTIDERYITTTIVINRNKSFKLYIYI